MTENLTKATFLEKVFNYEENKVWKFEGDKPALIDFYADKSLDELKDDLVKAQEKHSAAVLNQQRTGLNSDKIHIEDTSVRIQNLITIIKHRESGEQS